MELRRLLGRHVLVGLPTQVDQFLGQVHQVIDLVRVGTLQNLVARLVIGVLLETDAQTR